MRRDIKLSVTVTIDEREDVIEALRAALPSMGIKYEVDDNAVIQQYLMMHIQEAMFADERDLVKIAEVDKAYLLGTNVTLA